MDLNHEYLQIGSDIIGSAFEVRNYTGRGMREKYYEAALAWELRHLGHDVRQQVGVKAFYKGEEISDALQADILVDNKVLIEVKALRCVGNEEARQLFTYMKLTGIKLGYLINFGAKEFGTGNFRREDHPFERGIYRMVNDL